MVIASAIAKAKIKNIIFREVRKAKPDSHSLITKYATGHAITLAVITHLKNCLEIRINIEGVEAP